MIWKFQPFATDKRYFGQEYNAHCSIVPNDDDWILIIDYDCMILSRMAYPIIEKAIQRYPDTEIFGAMTNRVGYSFQRINPNEQDENDSIKHHLKIAEEKARLFADGQCKDSHTVAGFFLLFRKSYWNNNKFQDHIIDEKGNLFDYKFTLPAYKSGKKIRIIKGVYCWHTYRIEQENYHVKDHLRIKEMRG